MIRPYQVSDKPRLIELCREFWSSSCEEMFGAFDDDHTSKKIDQLLSSGACFVTDNVEGFILLCESTNLCNANPIAAEVAWYASSAAKKGSGIKLLLTAFRYCELKKIKALSMMYMESSMPESVKNIYVKLGLELAETTHIKRFD